MTKEAASVKIEAIFGPHRLDIIIALKWTASDPRGVLSGAALHSNDCFGRACSEKWVVHP